MLRDDYHPVTTGRRGGWLRTDEPGTPCGIPCDNRLEQQSGKPPPGWNPFDDIESRPAQ